MCEEDEEQQQKKTMASLEINERTFFEITGLGQNS